MKTFKIHPAAELVPMMGPEELKDLADSLARHGQKIPIILLRGKVIDGRNRIAACEIAGIEPKTLEWPEDDVEPADLVDALNDKRRHLTPSQRAAFAGDMAEFIRKATRSPAPGRVKATEQAAAAKGASVRSVERYAAVKRASPELAKKIREGDVTLKQAAREIKRADQVDQARQYVPPEGEYPVISVDFPWEYDDTQDGKGMERGLPYPSMTIDEICDFIDTKLKPSADCALFCWVTNPILLDPACWAVVAAKLSERWGFVAKQIRTWVKTNDADQQVTKQGWVWRGDTEHLIRLERGKPVFMPTGANHGNPIQRTSFRAPIGEHSEKPAAAYMDIEHICANTLRLEMFARAARPGWVTTGSELPGINLDNEASRPGANVFGSMKTEVVPGPAESLGDLTGTKFGERLAKHEAKKNRKLHATDCTAPNCPLCRGAA